MMSSIARHHKEQLIRLTETVLMKLSRRIITFLSRQQKKTASSHEQVQVINANLRYQKLCTRWVSPFFTKELKQKQKKHMPTLKQYECDGVEFLCTNVTVVSDKVKTAVSCGSINSS